MGSVMSGSAAVVVATGRDPAAFPFRCELSLTPLITFWTQLSAHREFGRGPIPGLVREKARAAPELAEVIDDLSVIEKHRGVAVIVIALGPLTNLALALRLDADALRRTRRVVMMAGAVDVTGNFTPDAEFNAYVDPDAAREVLDAGLRVDLVPLDATRQTTINRDQLHAALAGRPGPLAARIAAFTEQSFRLWGYMHLHDPLAVGLAVDASLARWQPARIAVGENGQTRRADGAPNCRVAHAIDAERFLALFFDRLCPASS
jgi:inosine-uridine nucleoside N-ribohydrolase